MLRVAVQYLVPAKFNPGSQEVWNSLLWLSPERSKHNWLVCLLQRIFIFTNQVRKQENNWRFIWVGPPVFLEVSNMVDFDSLAMSL